MKRFDCPSATRRQPGERVVHEAELWFGEHHPIRPQRLPGGRRAAIVINQPCGSIQHTHHTRSLVRTLPARTRNIRNERIHPSRSPNDSFCMAEGSPESDLTNPEFLSILKQAQRAGLEICPHSASPNRETAADLEILLARFRHFEPATWIDHQPETNCEAINNSQGLTNTASPFFILQALKQQRLSLLVVSTRYTATRRCQYVWPEQTRVQADCVVSKSSPLI